MKRKVRLQLRTGHAFRFVPGHDADLSLRPATDRRITVFLDIVKDPVILLALGIAFWRVLVDILDPCQEFLTCRCPLGRMRSQSGTDI